MLKSKQEPYYISNNLKPELVGRINKMRSVTRKQYNRNRVVGILFRTTLRTGRVGLLLTLPLLKIGVAFLIIKYIIL